MMQAFPFVHGAIAPERLGEIERPVRRGIHRLLAAPGSEIGNAAGNGDADIVPVGRDSAACDPGSHPFDALQPRLQLAGDDDAEFLSTQPCNDGHVVESGSEHGRDRGDDGIAAGVAETVVDRFEPVDVKNDK